MSYWFEDPEQFDRERGLPPAIINRAGSNGVALVDVFKNGSTTSGWGLLPKERSAGFMDNYGRGLFWPKPRLMAFEKKQAPFAIVMRSVRLIALDIDRGHDGGEDGFVGLRKLLPDCPVTLAETSKSGLGRHLFFESNEVWDDLTGYGRYDDAIGIAPGVDLRAVGCVYHYASQRWNRVQPAPLPKELEEILELKLSRKANAKAALAAAADMDDEDVIIMHDTLLQELNQPIPAGKRNSSLFAIGSKMREAQYPGWEDEVIRRGTEVGLGATELDKIVANIATYN